ncbi:MAG: transporter, partial [Zetaproteobacteria bacterium]
MLLSTPALAGGGDDPPPLPLSEAERLVLSRNPALAAADANAAALAAVPPQVGALPDPQLSFKALNLPV